jgi:hypothetical protein
MDAFACDPVEGDTEDTQTRVTRRGGANCLRPACSASGVTVSSSGPQLPSAVPSECSPVWPAGQSKPGCGLNAAHTSAMQGPILGWSIPVPSNAQHRNAIAAIGTTLGRQLLVRSQGPAPRHQALRPSARRPPYLSVSACGVLAAYLCIGRDCPPHPARDDAKLGEVG